MTTDTERRFEATWQELEDEPTSPGGEPFPQRTTIDNLLPFVPEVLENGELAPGEAQPPPVTAATLRAEIPRSGVQETGLQSAVLQELRERKALIRFRGDATDTEAQIADEVETELLEEARRDGQRVLVMRSASAEPLIVGVLLVRKPRATRWSGEVVEIEASRSLTLRSGRAGVRLDSDGHIELVGSRISAASRGLMRLVGRVLRLN